MQLEHDNEWPILTEYDQDHLARIALPLGGIGTGTVSLGGRGNLRDWEIMNRPAKGFTPGPAFFALYARSVDGPAVTRALEGPLDVSEYEGATGSTAQNHGLPRFRHCRFAAAYPLGQVLLSDPEVPLEVRIQAFNPLIPGDADRSGLPVAILRFVLTNPSSEPVTASVCGTLPNFIGMDGSTTIKGWLDTPVVVGAQENVNEFRGHGLFMRSEGVPSTAEQWGTMVLATTRMQTSRMQTSEAEGISYCTHWRKLSWGDSLLDFWDDFSADGELDVCPPEADVDMPVASLAVKQVIPAHSTRTVTFLLTWHFPNRQTWTPVEAPSPESCDCDGACASTGDPNRVGNYYTTRYRDAWDVAESVLAQLPSLEADTVQFVQTFCASDLPAVVKEAALFNLSSLRTQTCFRTEDGRLYGFEGCGDKKGCCLGSCTHVWNYEQATAFLFGDLAKTMRDVEFAHATRDDGLMSFRVHLPLDRAQESHAAAADGQLGCVMKMYRDWQLSGDSEFLQSLWPQVKKALAFCWIPGGWDADQDGVMEGCQHNTMDVEYYGPNPQMQAWYLGALRAAEEMARALCDVEFAGRCRDLSTRGSQWMDAHLFNGDYYEHEIRPPRDAQVIAPGLRVGMGSANLEEPELQLGAGCLVDQLVGQFMAHVCGLGYLLNRENVQQTLRSIMKYNFREGFYDHFNPMRSFVLGDESALLLATYPRGRRPRRPFPYHSEAMTGFEYAAAVGMLYEGQVDAGLKCITAIRARYDGRKRSPFDEAECGHHYARAMASWAAVLALTGFHYSAVTQTMAFKAQGGTFFWSNGYAWGMCEQIVTEEGVEVILRVLYGEVTLKRFVLTGVGETVLETPLTLSHRQSSALHLQGAFECEASPVGLSTFDLRLLLGDTMMNKSNQPNILFVFGDQWRAQATGYAGDPNVQTPNLDRFAAESLNFTHAVSNCPVCSPWRATLMTGQYPLTHGVFVNDVPISSDPVYLADVFKSAGYDTAYIGKWHIDGHGRSTYIPPERRRGFDYWKVRECTHDYNHSFYYGDTDEKLWWAGYDAIAQTKDAQAYIEHHDPDKPFLLMLSWGPPHTPYHTAPEEFRQLYNPADIELPPNVPEEMAADAREWLAGYYAHCSALDWCFDELLRTLDEAGLAENTLVVFTADHGDMLGSHGAQKKQRPWDESIRVPLLLRYPAAFGREGRQIDTPINSPDLMPTLLGLVGLSVPDTVEGHDFAPFLRGEAAAPETAALIELPACFHQYAYYRGGRDWRGLRTARYTYVIHRDGPWLLYDNGRDPYQLENLIGHPDYADVQAALDADLRQRLAARGDALTPGQELIRRAGYPVDERGDPIYEP